MTEMYSEIETVRKTGQVNMSDRYLVISRCKEMGYMKTAKWVSENPRAYARLIYRGHSPTRSKNELSISSKR